MKLLSTTSSGVYGFVALAPRASSRCRTVPGLVRFKFAAMIAFVCYAAGLPSQRLRPLPPFAKFGDDAKIDQLAIRLEMVRTARLPGSNEPRQTKQLKG